MIETICRDGQTLAYIVSAGPLPDRTTFLTPDEAALQVGYVVTPAGAGIQRHAHLPVERRIVGTAEVLLVQRGRCEVEIYSEQRELVATRELRQGDILVMVAGGHGFRMLEDTVLLEVKQGPYPGVAEKERF